MATVVFLAACIPVRAAEHITLRNGFEMDCTAREVIGDRVRLYTGTGGYVEVTPDAIASVDTVASNAVAGSGVSPAPSVQAAALTSAGTLAPMHTVVEHAGRLHHVDADLLNSIIRAESGGNARAVSPKGARGLMQLMPATATAMGVADSFVPEQNVSGGAAYLDRLLTLYHDDLVLAVAAYNAGPAAVARWHGVPPYRETQTYVARVVREFNRRKLAAQ